MIKKVCLIVFASFVLTIGIFFGFKYYCKYTVGYTKVYVASHQLTQRSLIKDDDLCEIEVPKDYLKDDVFLNKDEIIGKYVKLSFSIPKGSLIYKTSIEKDIPDLANVLLNKGEVNYDIFVNEIKVNTANLNKNICVDLYLTIDDKDKPISDLLLSGARITGLYDNNSKLIQDYEVDKKVSIISIAISKEYVSVLNKAQLVGEIKCVVSSKSYNANQEALLNNDSILFEYIN